MPGTTIPASAVSCRHFAREADFIVIDADDLAQYTLAIDRRHPHLAAQVDALNPSVLQLINLAVQGASAHNRPITLTGAIATDPQAIPILIGLGITGLNTHPSGIPPLKAQIGSMAADKCQELAHKALALDSVAQVRSQSN